MYKELPDRMYMVFRHLNSEVEYIRADLHQAEVDALHAECDRLTALVGNKNRCSWEPANDEDGWWLIACEGRFIYDDGGPVENGYKFCPYCGGEIWMGEGE